MASINDTCRSIVDNVDDGIVVVADFERALDRGLRIARHDSRGPADGQPPPGPQNPSR